MLRSIIEFALARRSMVLAILILFVGAGLVAFHRLNIEAYPDPSPPMMEIITQSPGQSAEEIERYITIPVEIAMAGMPGLEHVRSISLYGLSDVKVQFSYDSDYYFALQQVLNRLNNLTLPNNVQPQISPESAVGEVFRYQLVGPPGYSLTDLKTLQDWVLERRFRTVPGVIDVVGWGGLSKEYHVDVDLNKLTAYHITLPQVMAAIGNSNQNVGARTLDIGQQSANVRGIGLIRSIDDINNIVLNQVGGTPVLLKDVATSEIGHAQRLGISGRDSENDIVEGIVLMRRGEKTLEVINRIEHEVNGLNSSGVLPSGVKVVPYYDRRELIGVTTHTVLENLIFGIIQIFFVQLLFLGDLRSAIIVSASIPVALFFAIVIMYLRGDSANLLSVGAIDFGIIVDSTVIMVENIFRHLREGGGLSRRHEPKLRLHTSRLREIFLGAAEVDKSIFFSTAIIIAAFIPLFTMQGVEGQIFAPMAKTYGYAMIGSLLATFTVAPVLSSFLLPERVSEREPAFVRVVKRGYVYLLRLVLRYRAVTITAALSLLAITASVLPLLGTEFLPRLEEGNLWIRATLPPTISLDAGQKYVVKMREEMRKFPEVTTVVSQHGRPDDGTDPTGFFNAEFFVPLRPFDQWPRGVTKDKLIEQMKKQLEANFVGVDFNFSQTIQDNVEEAVSGVKGENSIKLFGTDLDQLEQHAQEIKDQISSVKGIEDVGVFTELGQPNLLIEVDRDRCARYGLATGDVNSIVQAAIGGHEITDVFEGERHFPIVVRLDKRYRQNVQDIKGILVPTPGGAAVPLGDLCEIKMQSGASYIYRENNERYIPIKFSVRGRDLGSAVAEARAKVEKTVKLPTGYHIEWSGEFGELQEAEARLAYIVPISILLIVILLYSTFNSLRDSLLVLVSIPFALIGGILGLAITGINFSVSAAVGFISLFGVAVMAGIILLSYYNQLCQHGYPSRLALIEAARVRMRPVLMMCVSACIGLFPAAISKGIGSETQRPLATVIVGGMLLAPILILLIVPVLISFLPSRTDLQEIESMEPEQEEEMAIGADRE
ncbi:MAG TPA: CusA/CzcA family heavy metal efflux RND transporter [Blastocatellia bacterium]|nr:CusA/CzcA family heavy metal efflux RND transporter [Blastocatellia bacterium]